MARNILSPILSSESPTTQTDATHGSYTVVNDASSVNIHDVGDANQLTLTVTVHQSPSGTSPTLDAKLQESNDKTNWADVAGAAITQMTALGTNTAKVPGSAATDAVTFARYVRIVALVGGTSTPTFTATYYLYPKE